MGGCTTSNRAGNVCPLTGSLACLIRAWAQPSGALLSSYFNPWLNIDGSTLTHLAPSLCSTNAFPLGKGALGDGGKSIMREAS